LPLEGQSPGPRGGEGKKKAPFLNFRQRVRFVVPGGRFEGIGGKREAPSKGFSNPVGRFF